MHRRLSRPLSPPTWQEFAVACQPPSWEVKLHPASPTRGLDAPDGGHGTHDSPRAGSPAPARGGGGGGGGAEMGRRSVPRLNLLRQSGSASAHGVELPESPPRSPPFSPTDNNRDLAADEERAKYPAGNWTFGERTIPPDEDFMSPRVL
jgi:hypothetical protein